MACVVEHAAAPVEHDAAPAQQWPDDVEPDPRLGLAEPFAECTFECIGLPERTRDGVAAEGLQRLGDGAGMRRRRGIGKAKCWAVRCRLRLVGGRRHRQRADRIA